LWGVTGFAKNVLRRQLSLVAAPVNRWAASQTFSIAAPMLKIE